MSTKMRTKIEDIIKGYLVKLSSKAQFQLLYLSKEYKRESQEMSVLRKILQKWSKENQKPEEITPEQSNNSDNLSVHGLCRNIGLCIPKENLKGLELS